MNTKILFCANVSGRWDVFLEKLNLFLKTCGVIDAVFCVGTIFSKSRHGLDSFINGEKHFPIPIYFVCGEETFTSLIDPIPNGGEVCSNFHFLGRFGIQIVQGLRVCFLSGIFDPIKFKTKQPNIFYRNFYTAEDLKSVQVHFSKIDILLSTEWPTILNTVEFSKKLNQDTLNGRGSNVVQKLLNNCDPQFHLACKENIYFSSKAHNYFVQPQSTQFVGLGSFSNQNLEQYFFAAKFLPKTSWATKEIQRQIPENGYNCSFYGSKRRKNNFFSSNNSSYQFKNLEKKTIRKKTYNQNGCGYCYQSPGLIKHLLISVGLHVYLTVARTPIVPNHFFIVTNQHTSSSIEMDENQKKEVEVYLKSLSKAFHSQILLLFERNVKIQTHGYLEVVPIAQGQLPDLLRTLHAFERRFHVFFQKINKEVNIKDLNCEYGFLIIGTSKGERYLHIIDPSKPKVRTDLLRRMVCRIIGFPDTYDYRKQRSSRNEQNKLIMTIKKKFSPFDPHRENHYSIPIIKKKMRIRKQLASDEER